MKQTYYDQQLATIAGLNALLQTWGMFPGRSKKYVRTLEARIAKLRTRVKVIS